MKGTRYCREVGDNACAAVKYHPDSLLISSSPLFRGADQQGAIRSVPQKERKRFDREKHKRFWRRFCQGSPVPLSPSLFSVSLPPYFSLSARVLSASVPRRG